MGTAGWEEKLSLGWEPIDAEHRLQIGMIQALQKALEDGEPDDKSSGILQQLIDFTNVHFLAEEMMMRLHQYPGYEVHVQEHDRLINQLIEIQGSFAAGQKQRTLEEVEGFERWLSGHIQGLDQALAQFLSRAVSA